MSAEGTLWKLVGFAAVILTVAVPAYIAYDLYNRGPDPEKRIEISEGLSIDLLSSLSGLRDRATVSITVEDETYDNLVIVHTYFANIGDAPVLPSDYHKKLSVSVRSPWKMVAVENGNFFGQNVVLDWNRVSDRVFEAEPALLNPGDRFSVSAFFTNTEFRNTSEEVIDPKLDWNARITNLRSFAKGPDTFERLTEKYGAFPPIMVELRGWGVIFTIGAAIVFQALYLHLLLGAGFLREWTWKSVGLIVLTGLLSVVSAGSMATYLFGNIITEITGVNHWLNGPPIILHAMFLTYLWWRARMREEKTPLEAGDRMRRSRTGNERA